jgi:hypothetical protein
MRSASSESLPNCAAVHGSRFCASAVVDCGEIRLRRSGNIPKPLAEVSQ